MRRPLSLSLLLFVLVSPNGRRPPAMRPRSAPYMGTSSTRSRDCGLPRRAPSGDPDRGGETGGERRCGRRGRSRPASPASSSGDPTGSTPPNASWWQMPWCSRADRAATASLASLSGADARQLVGDADIPPTTPSTRYPATQRPRLVYVTPEELALNGKPAGSPDPRQLSRFRRRAGDPRGWQPALLLARGANELHLRLPQASSGIWRLPARSPSASAPRPWLAPAISGGSCLVFARGRRAENTATVVLRPATERALGASGTQTPIRTAPQWRPALKATNEPGNSAGGRGSGARSGASPTLSHSRSESLPPQRVSRSAHSQVSAMSAARSRLSFAAQSATAARIRSRNSAWSATG